jgi:hypothetical protein
LWGPAKCQVGYKEIEDKALRYSCERNEYIPSLHFYGSACSCVCTEHV